MTLPIDIANKRFTWVQLPSQDWTTPEFRAPVVAMALGLETGTNWVRPRSVAIVERFATTGIVAHLPFGPTHAVDLPARPRRDGIPILNVRVTRNRDGRLFEVSMPFLRGADTSPAATDAILALGRQSLLASEKAAR